MTINHNQTSLLPESARLGRVHLTVSDIERSLDFYQAGLGLKILNHQGGTAMLGTSDEALIVLTEHRDAVAPGRTTGLYHFALLVPSRLDLAKTLRNIIGSGIALQGASDHWVSKALYLADPDGNGIEIYRDRPRREWQVVSGQIQMSVDPLDYEGLMDELKSDYATWTGLPDGTTLGHMHLHVSHLKLAEEFYTEVIGVTRTFNIHNSASFLSVGGYHHHLGINTWQGVGAPPPPENAIGLRNFSVLLQNQNDLEMLAKRVVASGSDFEWQGDPFFVHDPSQNRIHFMIDGAAG